MTGKAFIGIVIVYILSEISALLVGIWVLWGYRRNEMSRAFFILLTATAVNRCCSFMANLSRPENVHYPRQFIAWTLTGMVVQTTGTWLLAIFLTKRR